MTCNAFIRARNVIGPSDVVTLVHEALEVDGRATFFDAGPHRPDRPVFELLARGQAVLVVDAQGQHVGTFSDVGAAVLHGYAVSDRAPNPPRRRRSIRTERAWR